MYLSPCQNSVKTSFPCNILLKLDNRLLSYGQQTMFILSVVRHLEFYKFLYLVTRLSPNSKSDAVCHISSKSDDFCRAMLRISAAYGVIRRLSVRSSVRLSRSWIMLKRINISSNFFHHRVASGSHTILVFPHETGWGHSDGNRPNGGVECKCGRQKTRFWTNIWLRCIQVNRIRVAKCEKNKTATNDGKRRTLTAASVVRCSHKTTTKCL